MEHERFNQEEEEEQSSGRRSPDFEFWMIRNPSCPQPDLHTADELFINGVLRPLHLLKSVSDPLDPELSVHKSEQDPLVKTTDNDGDDDAGDGPELTAFNRERKTLLTASKRWKDMIFRNGGSSSGKDKEKKKEMKSQNRTSSSAELNINIWPFSRSRSAGNNGVRSKQVTGGSITRKVSSAPCSRSNSAGDSKTRKLPNSPSRNGVHLGRTSPVWQLRRATEKGVTKNHRSMTPATMYTAASGGGCKTNKVLNLNVPPVCTSYRNHLSCKSDRYSAVKVCTNAASGGWVNRTTDCNVGGGGDGGGNLFSLRSLFTKKVY